uniref:Major facilitator superfamily (MFS) profile domain-containing protein n=1 Tax=Graphocephala atropunctata TaxID=36148 RepID=A0A1B6LD98_9HEMI
MAYDDILLHLGEFGPYQRRIYLLLCLPAIVCALHKLAGVFLQAKAEHRCLLPYELNNASYFSLTEQQTRLSYPWDYLAKGYSACNMYDTNYTEEYFLNNVPANRTTRCERYVYNTEKYQSTTLMEWDLVCDSAWLKATSDAVFMSGVLLGSLIFGDLSDRYGRRPIFFFSLVVQTIAGVLAGVTPDYYSFTFFRMIVGAATSGVFLVAYVIGMEMVGPKKRTFAGVAIQYFFTTGFLLTAGFAYYIKDWRHLQIAYTVCGVVFFSYYWFIPESARWLLTKGRQEEARLIVKAAAKENKVDLPDDILDNLLTPTKEEEKMEEAGEKPSLFDLFKYPNLRKKSVILFFLWFVNSMTYYGLSWNTSNLGGGNDYVNFLICGLVEVPAYTFLLMTLDRWGRKVILCGCMLASGTALLLTMFVPNDMVWLTITLAMMGKLAITASYGTIYLFSAEQFPTVIRNVGVGASSMFARFGSILAPYINITAEIWQPMPLLIFGVCALVSGIISLILPETLNRKLPESIEEGERFGKKPKQKVTKNGELDPVC